MSIKINSRHIRIAAMSISMILLCGCALKIPSGSKKNESVSSDEAAVISLINSKSEVASQIDELAAAYKAESGVTVEVQNISSGVDAQALLKGLYLADELPDIIVCESSGFDNWDGLLTDMSGEAWVSDTDSAFVDPEYGTLGFPYATEAIGLSYNADILEKAGVDPASITGPESFKEALDKIDSQKSALGLTAVVGYGTNLESLSWSTGNHIFGNYLDSGLDRDDTTYIDLFNESKSLDYDRLKHFLDFIYTIQQHSDPSLLTMGTYEDQVRNFAAGKYAFITQGSWIGALLNGDYSEEYASAGNFKVGMLPYCFEEGMDTILTSPPSWWAVPKEGNSEAAKAFLQWCSEDTAQKILVEDAGFISPFNSCSYMASDPFAETVSEYLSSGKTSSWHWMNIESGFSTQNISPLFYDFASGALYSDGFYEKLSESLENS
ncbi:ABC transporter substrate-binding protein [Lachnospiraceae bacterium C1.1]|nr:ABC transporter substrate-binding protein [Lachnospiraceae bacterium C1.1]